VQKQLEVVEQPEQQVHQQEEEDMASQMPHNPVLGSADYACARSYSIDQPGSPCTPAAAALQPQSPATAGSIKAASLGMQPGGQGKLTSLGSGSQVAPAVDLAPCSGYEQAMLTEEVPLPDSIAAKLLSDTAGQLAAGGGAAAAAAACEGFGPACRAATLGRRQQWH
jgi:hypothetical protein